MRVMMIAPEGLPIPPRNGGSVQIYLSNLFREFADRNDIDVLLVSPGNDANRRIHSPHATQLIIPGKKLAYWRHVHRLIQTYKPDLVQIDNRPAQALQIMRVFPNQRVILNLHSITFLGKSHISLSDAQAVLTRAAVVCNSRGLARAIRSRFKLHHRWRPHIIYPGVIQRRTDNLMHAKTPHSPLRILFVGRVIEQKGVHILLRAVRELHQSMPIRLTIVGGTHPWEKSYRLRVKRMARGLNVRFTGFVQPEKLHTYYKTHDILVCPSQQLEAFGLVNLEAMSYGIPVIASQIGGIPEAVGNQGAVLVKAYRRPTEFAAALRLLSTPARYRTYSTAALRHARRFTWRKTAQAFTVLYLKDSALRS